MTIPNEWYLGQTSTSTCSDVGGPVTLESIARLKEQLESPVQATDEFDTWCFQHPDAIVLCSHKRKADLERVKALYPSMKNIRIVGSVFIQDEQAFLADIGSMFPAKPVLEFPKALLDTRVHCSRYDVPMYINPACYRWPHGASKNQVGLWQWYSWRRRKVIKYRVNRRPIRGPQFRTKPYHRSCISNFGEYRSVL